MTSNDHHSVIAAAATASSAVVGNIEDTVGIGIGISMGGAGSEVLDYNMAASTSNQKINMADVETKWKDMPDKYFIIIAHFLAGHINDTDEMDRFSGPILKASIKSVYWLFLIQYAALAMLGVLMNIAIIVYVLYHRIYKDITHAFIVNLAFCHTVQCAVVLPISLMVMLIQNWIFGQFLCFFLPMLQDIPLHVAMISHILIAWDRMRWLNDPLKDRLPAFVCCCATWLTGMVIALPYPIYTIYVELGDYVSRLSGMGLCVVNLMDDMHEYTRGLFLIMYCAPAILLAYLYIRTSQELRPPEGPFAVMMYEHRADVRIRQRNSSASSVERNTAGMSRTASAHSNSAQHASSAGGAAAGNATSSTRSYDLYSAELDVHREKRKQRNYGSMAAVQVVCICPLMILRFARLSLEETYENQKHFDFTYLMFVWIAFLPTVIFPCMYASQILPREEQERLRGYFRLSSKSKSRRTADGNGNGDANAIDDTVANKENQNSTTLAVENGDSYTVASKKEATKSLKANNRDGKGEPRHANRDKERQGGMAYRHGKDKYRGSAPLAGRGAADAGVVNNLGKDMRSKKHDVKINIISDGQAQNMRVKSTAARHQRMSQGGGGSTISGRGQRKLTIESTDNNSCSNFTASTFLNGSSGIMLDDSSTSNYGDGEESSVVSSMMVPNSSHLARWNNGGLSHKDVSFSECSSSFSRMDSPSSTLERDLEIIDRLERERSMDIQEMMEREKHGEKVRLAGERRLLPDIEKLYAQRSPKMTQKHDMYNYDNSMTMTPMAGNKEMHIQMVSTSVLPGSDPLSSLSHHSESYSLASTLSDDLPHDSMLLEDLDEEEVPQDFYDSYTPGANTNIPPLSNLHQASITSSSVASTAAASVSASAAAAAAANSANAAVAAAVAASAAVPSYQYQYTRRLSRKASHHSSAGVVGLSSSSSSHRVSKRDSFNSLNGTDLIAGAFGELDPTQPLNKMSVIDGRMRRSSPRNSSFSSSSARSSLKSRDYGHGSTHSAHPELDFRENIFAEL